METKKDYLSIGLDKIRPMGRNVKLKILKKKGQIVLRVMPQRGIRAPKYGLSTPKGMANFMELLFNKHKIVYGNELGKNQYPSKLYLRPKIHGDVLRAIESFILPNNSVYTGLFRRALQKFDPDIILSTVPRDEAKKYAEEIIQKCKLIRNSSNEIRLSLPEKVRRSQSINLMTRQQLIRLVACDAFNNLLTPYFSIAELILIKSG